MRVVLGLGGNVGDVGTSFATALRGLATGARVEAVSSLWRTAPVGPDQPEFLNAAALVGWPGHPLELLVVALGLEAAAGRDRRCERRWGPRTLDLDLLLAEDIVIESPGLVVPHPRLAERRFALAPAAELVPDWRHPRLHRTVADLAADRVVAGQRCERIGRLEGWESKREGREPKTEG